MAKSGTAKKTSAQGAADDAPYYAHLTVARVDPWTVLKASFLLSVAFGIALVVCSVVIWMLLNGIGVFGMIENFLNELGAASLTSLLDYVTLPRFVSYAMIVGVLNVVLFTALGVLAAFLYNLIAALVGGVRVTLLDE